MTLSQFQQQTNSQKKTFPYFICHNPLKKFSQGNLPKNKNQPKAWFKFKQ